METETRRYLTQIITQLRKLNVMIPSAPASNCSTKTSASIENLSSGHSFYVTFPPLSPTVGDLRSILTVFNSFLHLVNQRILDQRKSFTMLDVTVKTLDGKNHSFSVPDDITVGQFKQKIAGSVSIEAESQRLIFIGRVLQDEKKLNDYDINGKTMHLVARPPPSAQTRGATSGGTTNTSTHSGPSHPEGGSFVVGSFTLPSEPVNAQQIQGMVQQAIGNMGDAGRNARISTRASDDGSSVDVHINLGQMGGPAPPYESQSEQRVVNARRMITRANAVLDRLEHPPRGEGSPDGSMDTSASEAPSEDAPNSTPQARPTPSDDATAGPQQSRTARSTFVTSLAPLLDEVMALNARLQPHLLLYQGVMRDDPSFPSQDPEIQRRQRLCNLVSETLHYISHAYHSISDLMVDVSREPPRLLYAVPTPRPVHRLIQQTAPMRMSSNVQGSPSTAGRNPPANTTTPSSTAPSTPSSNPTPNPQSNPQLQQPMPPGVPPMFMMSGSPMSFIINASPHGPQPASRMPVGANVGVQVQHHVVVGSRAEQRPTPNTTQPTARPSGTPGPSPAPPNAAPSAPAGPPRTPRPPGPPMMMGGIPIMMPPTGHVDPHLPCQSRHFLLRRANQAANAGTAQDAAEPAMTNIIQNVMSSMFGQGVTMQGRPSSAAAPVGSENPAMAHLRHMLSQVSQANPNAAVSSSATSSTQSAPSEAQGAPNATQNATQTGHLTDDMFTQLVSGIGSFVSRAASGQPTNVTLADFLNELGQGQGVSTGDGLLTEIFNAVSTELTFIDLLTIFLGNAAPLSNARGSLRAFVNERVLQGQTNTQEHMAAGIDRLIEELQPDITAISNESNVKDDIDFGRTLVRFTRAHLTTLCEMVVRTEVNDETFANDLVAAVKRAIHEFIVLCRSCLEGDVSALDALIQARVRSWTGEINPLIQQWMISNSSQQLSQIMPTITVTNADVVGYIVKREAVSQASSEASYMSAESGEDHAKEAEGMDVEEASKPPPMDATLLSRLPLPPRRDEMDVGIEAVGSADWHRVVPSEWVPVISRDVARQQRDSAQPPFSDAYLNGMPAKRRKLMSQSESELSNLPAVLPEALKRAATSVGAQSLTSLEDMAKEASSSSELINTFQTEVNNTLANRVAKDPDYIPEKYPHCEQVYKKSD